MCPLLTQLKIGFFSSFSDAAVYSTNEANKAGLKQSIIFRCLWFKLTSGQFNKTFFEVFFSAIGGYSGATMRLLWGYSEATLGLL
jgi:hypothetical protein